MRSRRLGALLCVALLGVLLAIGLVVVAAAGPLAGAGYAVVSTGLVAAAAVRGRSVLAPPAVPTAPSGRTCTCCTTSQLDPVRVL